MTIFSILTIVHNLFTLVTPIIVSLGVVYFIWGVVQYVIADAEEAKKTGKDRIIYGIVGLTIIVGLWGIVGIVSKSLGLGGASSPLPAGQGGCNLNAPIKTLVNLAGYINCTIRDSVIPFLFAVALVTFVWGVVKFFIIDADEEAKRTQGKQFMIWGILAMTVMMCVWGLVKLLGNTFHLF